MSRSGVRLVFHPPSESRTPLCGLRIRCITRQCLRGACQSAREDSNLRAPVYQTGAWTDSATGGAGETRTHKAERPGGFRDRFLIQPGPLHQVGRTRTASSGATAPRSGRVSYAPGTE